MTKPWSGRAVTTATHTVVTQAAGICWLCHHPGATTLDHAIPRSVRPDLAWNPANWRAAHHHPAGRPGGCTTPECHCPGNTGRGTKPADDTPSRSW